MTSWIWIIGAIIIGILIWVIYNLIKTKDKPQMVRYGGSGGVVKSGGFVKNFLLKCCGRGRY